jgi:hypothetical protein
MTAPSRLQLPLILATLILLGGHALAGAPPDPKSLYEITTAGTSGEVRRGEKGTFVLAIRCKAGAHVSDEAPLRIELTGKNLQPEKAKLTLADSVATKAEGQKYVEPKFEVPFLGTEAGQGSLQAKMTFFICTDELCARQSIDVTSPVQVRE